jgi:uncharacterized protein
MERLNLKLLVSAVLEDYALPWDGIHGLGHWARVLENGLRLAEVTGANVDVIQLFAVFHDSRRVNESSDLGHGMRGAELAARLRGTLYDLPDAQFALLYEACAAHADGLTAADITIQTCWDADRLDLGRVGMRPEPTRLCTDAAKQPEIINWADGRAAFGVMPDFMRRNWLIS